MRKLLLTALILCSSVLMGQQYNVPFAPLGPPPTIFLDVFTADETLSTSDPHTFDHIAGASPEAVLVSVHQVAGSATGDNIVEVRYGGSGGTVMTELTNSPLIQSVSDNTAVHVFFLGSSVPTGTQEVWIDKTGGNTSNAYAYTFNSDGDMSIQDEDIVDAVTADPTCPTLSLGGDAAFVGFSSSDGHGNTTDVTDPPRSGWLNVGNSDMVSNLSVTGYKTKVQSSDVSDAGYDATSDNVTMICWAIKET